MNPPTDNPSPAFEQCIDAPFTPCDCSYCTQERNGREGVKAPQPVPGVYGPGQPGADTLRVHWPEPVAQAVDTQSHWLTAPSPEEFQTYVTRILTESAGGLLRMMLDNNKAGDLPLTTDVALGVIHVSEHVERIIKERGQQYGEDVLFILGEPGFVVMAMSKMLRLFWSYQQGLPASDRRDSWVDMVGYGVLCLAYEQYNEKQAKEAAETESQSAQTVLPL